MPRKTSRSLVLTLVLVAGALALASTGHAQSMGASRLGADDPNNWPMYHRSYDGVAMRETQRHRAKR